jgi:hypothetical protein
MTEIDYGKGRRQRKIIALGQQNTLTFGDFLQLFGETESYQELERLIERGYIVIDETSDDQLELTPETKIKWLATNTDY